MLTRDQERLLLERAVAAGYLSGEDATATAEVRPPRSPPTYSQQIDRLIQAGKLSPQVVHALLQEPDLHSANTPHRIPAPPQETQPPQVGRAAPMDATLDGNSEEAQSIRAAARQLRAGGNTLAGESEVVSVAEPSAVERFPVENWDRYELIKLLGQGGMGSVYKGRDRRLGRIVALKFIRSGDPQMNSRFMQEARAQSRVDHPGICKVFDVGEVNDKAYIVMQFVDGQPLQQAARQLTMIEKVQIVRDAAEALHAAHEIGIIHRDIKPTNIMIERTLGADGTPRNHPIIMDFGLAREAHEGKGLTESGAVLGTPAYMSPEQARGDIRSLDRRTDVYSLGATLYDLLSGTAPFEDESVVNVLMMVLNEDVRPLRQKHPEIPEALDTIVSKCLNKEAAQRYQTAQALADDLGRYLNNQRIVGKQVSLGYRLRYRAQRNKPVAALLSALLLAGCGFVGYGTRTYLQNQRKEREAKRKEAEAKRRAELAQQLGQTVQEMEWLLRVANGLPLHDTTPDKARVRSRMAEVARVLAEAGPLAAGLGNYVLGRGHLALYEWEPALQQMKAAEAAGVDDAELHYALGRVMGELYMEGMDKARKSGDPSFQERRRKELEAQYLQPALAYLNKSRGRTRESASYAEALIDFYNGRYDAALINAHMAQRQTPWLYEAKKLEGDVFAARALAQKDRGDPDQAERNYLEAIHRYEQAAEIGRSDHRIYEAIAEAWIRQEEMDLYRGRDPELKLRNSLSSADKAIEALPIDTSAYVKKTYAHYFQSRYLQNQGESQNLLKSVQRQIAAGEQAIKLNPRDEYAYDAIGHGYLLLAMQKNNQGEDHSQPMQQAIAFFNDSIRNNVAFPWAHNDLGLALMLDGHYSLLQHINPSERLLGAISAFNKATSIDSKYFFPYGNQSYAYNELATWRTEHGQDPSAEISRSIESAKFALKINPDADVVKWNIGLAHALMLYFKIDSDIDANAEFMNSQDWFNKFFTINNNISDSHLDYARLHYSYLLRQPQANSGAEKILDAGRQAIQKCNQVNHGPHYGCMAVEALLLSVQGQQQAEAGKSPLPTLAKALERARTAREHSPKDSTILLSAAEACLRTATVKKRVKASPAADLREGIAAIEAALGVAPGWPRALAIKGALLVHAAAAQVPTLQRSTYQQAKDALEKGIAGNPLLKNRYGAALAEAEAGLVRQP